MKRYLLLIFSLGWTVLSFSQTVAGENAKYFHRVTDKSFRDLKKDEVAFIYKGEEFYMKNMTVYRKRPDIDKLGALTYGEVYDMLKDCPRAQKKIHSGYVLQCIGTPILSIPLLAASLGNYKKGIRVFYNDYLCKIPETDLTYSVNYVPATFVKQTTKQASELLPTEVAFTYDGEKYYMSGERVLYKESKFSSRGMRMVVAGERLALMNKQGKYGMKELGRFYAEMNSDPSKAVKMEAPVAVNPVSTPVEKPVVVEAEEKNTEPQQEVKQEVKQEVAVAPVADQPKEELKKEESKKEEAKVKEPKPEREHLEKLNVRKQNGFGLFVDAGGFLTRGPRLGLEMRFNRCIPFFFAGYPQMGYFFKKDYEDYTSIKSISAGVGCKGLVPTRWGGFYAGGYAQYNRVSAETAVGSYQEQKVLDNCIDVMAGVGFRFQFKCNLFFNVGGYAGPAINMRSERYSNILYNDYSPKYQSGDTEIKVKGNAELSIGYEF